MKRLTLKRHFTLLVMAAFWTTASPIGVDSIKDSNNDSVNEMKEQCEQGAQCQYGSSLEHIT